MLKDLIEAGVGMANLSLPPTRHGLSVLPTSCGYERRDEPGYDWDGRNRGSTPFTILQYTISGRGQLRMEGVDHTVGEGEAMVLTVPQDHRYWVAPGQQWEFFWISMRGSEALRIHDLVHTARGPVTRLRSQTADEIAGVVYRLMRGEGETAASASALAYQALMLLFDDAFGASEPDELPDGIARVVANAKTSPSSLANVSDMAEAAGLSRAHFTREFARLVGQSPAQFLMDQKMRLAAGLLVETRIPIADIARRTGFRDANYFAKAFRRAFYVSPSEYRTSGMYAGAR